ILVWRLRPMQGGIYLILDLDDSKNWRFIILEEKIGSKSSMVLKLHDSPDTRFDTAEKMASYTRN
ncbi:MAG: hypothetical protein LH618_05645, partial [Saprospiraceae bacterium]|nr:hypothetical protein [Saprospiraceae bacterium]